MQVQQRVEHIIGALLPHMHGLHLLAAESKLSRTLNITEFQTLLQELSTCFKQSLPTELSSTFGSSEIPQRPLTNTSNVNYRISILESTVSPAFNIVTNGKRPRPISSLLPPSPEIKQKRKTSNSTM